METIRTLKLTGLVTLVALALVAFAPATHPSAQGPSQEPNRPESPRAGNPAGQQPGANPGGNQRGPQEPKNLQVLKGMTGQQVIQEMRAWSAALGVECNFCHQAPFETDTPRKHVARLMLRDYVQGMKHKDGKAATCNDCHQGQPNFLRVLPFESVVAKPAAGLQVLRGMPRQQLMGVMQEFTKALGVQCNYCHKEGDFEAETPRKQLARFMVTEYSRGLTKADGSAVHCNDCHQGIARPLTRLPFPRRQQQQQQRPAPSGEQGEKKPNV